MFQSIKQACDHIRKPENTQYRAKYLQQAAEFYLNLTHCIQLQEEGTDDTKLPKTTPDEKLPKTATDDY